ncbi:hypothetical protein Cni_G02576 [Canna indica]|uniref:RAB6-interacting golgin n=1 Tax=Canna indica TaxID=4628 RepID=A0AAQ3JSZ0_9LILI|nr:hypothetical protein Cni_G02576 [Canna indica]
MSTCPSHLPCQAVSDIFFVSIDQTPRIKNSAHNPRDNTSKEERSDDEASRIALSAFRAKEEQIEKKKMEVREKELEAMADPTRKEVSAIHKKIGAVNRELKPLGHNFLKKEYKEALEAFNGKSREKAQLEKLLLIIRLNACQEVIRESRSNTFF